MGKIFDNIKKEPKIKDPERKSVLTQDIEMLRAYREVFRTLYNAPRVYSEDSMRAFDYALGVITYRLDELSREYEEYV